MGALSLEDLDTIRRRVRKATLLDEGAGRARITVHMGTCGIAAGAEKIMAAFASQVQARGLDDVLLTSSGCGGLCSREPMATVEIKGREPVRYVDLNEKAVAAIVESLVPASPGRPVDATELTDTGFFDCQTLVALRNRGSIDSGSIDEYIARDGYRALARALLEMSGEQIVDVVKKSGLRGRGGGGFPTGLKWELCRKSSGEVKYIICNADEGDPGAYMDRSIVESDPHAVLEGMMIGARAIGAAEGYVYIREEYPLAMKRLETAIQQARQYGLIGENIFGSDFSFDVHVKRGAGAFVCGEETSLIASIEGKAPEPRQRPPFPAQSGLWGKPTNINNVETWATVPVIIMKGWEWFSSMGTEKSKGTKVFSLVGKIRNTGLIEVLMGTTLRQIIYEIGGGIPGDKQFKAVQTGGPSGGVIPARMLDLAVDYESLQTAGSIMGSGGMIVMDEGTCMPDVARYFLGFTTEESCGKCFSCREGAAALREILDRICSGRGEESDLDILEQLCYAIKDASMCGLGQTLPNPVLSTLKYFRDEYLAHVREKTCPAKVCKPLITYSIDPEICRGCNLCARDCPEKAISGTRKQPYVIDQAKCVKCGICLDVCSKAFDVSAVVVK